MKIPGQQVAPNDAPRTPRKNDPGVRVVIALVVLNQTVIRTSVQDDPVLGIGPRTVVADREVVATHGGDNPVVPIVMGVVSLDQQVIRVIMQVEPILDVVVHLVVQPLHPMPAKRVNPEVIVMNPAVLDVAQHMHPIQQAGLVPDDLPGQTFQVRPYPSESS